AGTVLATFFFLRLISLFGRTVWNVLASLLVLVSAGASYYMTFMNVMIGYGIVASVMTTDIDLSKEVVGWSLIAWIVLVSIIPLILIWMNRSQDTFWRQLCTPKTRWRSALTVLLAGLLVWGPIRLMDVAQKRADRMAGVDMPSYG
ncbi:phosphoethanolamine transferase domain-containing protein, partial [Escherichia coli]|uniref:phosphoethanolamine transferase domain-containing protein n=2 Tax=Escherichia TaxID=561 RepID=UPI001FA6F960